MADVRQYEAQKAAALDPHRDTRLIPTPEEARRSQEAARRAQSLVDQSVGGWGGTMGDLQRGAREEAERQLAGEARGVMLGMAYDRAGAPKAAQSSGRVVHIAQGGIAPPLDPKTLAQVHGQGGERALLGHLQQSRAPGKTFSREAILAIIAAERTKWFDEGTEVGSMRYRAAMQALDELQRIFEKLE